MKNTVLFQCSHCNAQFQKWIGRCLECGKWGTVDKSEITPEDTSKRSVSKEYSTVKTIPLKDIAGKNLIRINTKIDELDRVLGGGVVPGSLILLGGEPGIGKSTLALQLATLISPALYFSGEESVEQIKLRADRLHLNPNNLELGSASAVENIINTIKSKKPNIAIIDSIQTIYSVEAEGESGNLAQVRACTVKLMELAKTTGVTIILIGQVTKDGAVAGPKTLEHLVDVVLYLEGDKFHQYRILRAAKNRFGSTDEIGVFAMNEKGLEEVKNPSAAFLAGRDATVPGSVITCLMEGSRPVLVEVQALVTKTNFGYPQRRSSGFDMNRLQVLIGVLTKRAGLPLDGYDVFLNVVGGLTAEEPAADLAVVLALASAIRDKTLSGNIAAFGEVGLGGEVRAVNHAKKRLEEIKKMGLEFAVTPVLGDIKISGLKIAPIKNVREIVEKVIK